MDLWSLVSGIAGAISAVAALLTIYQARLAAKELQNSERPYFAIEETELIELDESTKIRITLNLRNVGNHPASDLRGGALMTGSDLSNAASVHTTFSVANDIPAQQSYHLVNEIELTSDIPPQFFIVITKYADPILNRTFDQVSLFVWDGVSEGIVDTQFSHAPLEKREAVLKYLANTSNLNLPELK